MKLQEILHQGELYLSNSEAEKAIILFDTVLAHDQNCFSAWLGKGTALKLLQRYQKALDCYEQALILNNDSSIAQFMASYLRHKLDKREV